MADNVSITPGSGAVIATDDVSGVEFQIVKFDVGAAGSSALVTAAGTNYIPVKLASVGSVTVTVAPAASQSFPVVNVPTTTLAVSASAALPVSAVVAAPVFVQLSDGTNPITTLPVGGTVTAAQGTAAAATAPWPVEISSGAGGHIANLTLVSAAYALDVNITKAVGLSGFQADESAFTEGAGIVAALGGLYNDSIGNPSSGQIAALRSTQLRALHINIRKNDGTELGIAATPLRVDPTGSTTQPVSGTVSAEITKMGGDAIAKVGTGIQKVAIVNGAGTAWSDSVPLSVTQAVTNTTKVTNNITLSASQTAQAVWTPASGKKFVIDTIILTVSVTGTLRIFDGTDGATARVFDGTIPTGIFIIPFTKPWISDTADNVLKYTSGTGLTAVISTHGHEV